MHGDVKLGVNGIVVMGVPFEGGFTDVHLFLSDSSKIKDQIKNFSHQLNSRKGSFLSYKSKIVKIRFSYLVGCLFLNVTSALKLVYLFFSRYKMNQKLS